MMLLNHNIPPRTIPTKKLQAVILDWAGTAVDFGSLAPVRTLQRVFEEFDLPVTEQEARRDMGLAKREHIRAILASPEIAERWIRKFNRPAGGSDVETLYQRFIPLQFACLAEYAAVIPGVKEAVERLRERRLAVGTTTGYTRPMLDLLIEKAGMQGYRPDANLCPDDVGMGRPHPYMIYENAVRLQVSPLASIVKVGDTPADIQEGLNAGVWSVGVALTGNMIGLSEDGFRNLTQVEREQRRQHAVGELTAAGAHYVIDSVAELDSVLDDVERILDSSPMAGASS
jgi:phosphonoacetaldehyde hydrolase